MTSSQALDLAGDLIARYHIAALEDFIDSCRAFAGEKTLNVAVFGRFKAGKSSFLNHLLGKPVLPVGVIPVTSVITRIEFGLRETAEVRFLDGRVQPISPAQVGDFVSEAANPGNVKQVALVHIELPEMERYRGISLVDTPGLESVFARNSDVSMEWLPNVGLALVAVGVDPPLTQHDIDLIRSLSRYTPNVSLLLTKVDLLESDERSQVEAFVHEQLARYWNGSVAVLPYSVRPGFEHLRAQLEERLLSPIHTAAEEQHAAIMRHKADALLGECRDYLNIALKAAQPEDSERDQLRQGIFSEKEFLGDTRLTLQITARHAAGTTRARFEDILRKDEQAVRQRLLADLDQVFPGWTRSLKRAIDRFEDWLHNSIAREIAACSRQHRSEFLEPARRVSRQLSQSLQDFRNRLSERTLAVLGVPLRTTQMELEAADPPSPDIRVGKIFDHNWELLSFAAPMALWKGLVKGHFEHTVADVVFVNLSRLASQWEELVNAALLSLEKDATGRLDSLIATIENLLASAGQEAPRIQADLARIDSLTDPGCPTWANNTASPPASAPSAPPACHSDRIS